MVEKRRVKQLIIFLPIFILNGWFRIMLNRPLTEAISTPDSVTYRESGPGPQTFPYEGTVPLDALSDISFAGHSIRPWPINLIYSFLGSDFLIITFQTLFAAFAWSYFILTLIPLISRGVLKIVFLILVFAFSLTEYVYSWEKFILSESLINSVFILFSARIISSRLRIDSNLNFLVNFFLFLFIFLSRPIFGIWLAFLLILGNKSFKVLLPRATLILLSITYVFIVNSNSSQKWQEYLGSSREGISFAYIRNFSVPSSTKYDNLILKLGAPECLVNLQGQGNSPWEIARKYDSACPEGLIWLDKNFSKSYLLHLIEPSNFFERGLVETPNVLAGADYRSYFPFYQFVEINQIKSITRFFWHGSYTSFILKVLLSVSIVIAWFWKREWIDWSYLFFLLILSVGGSVSQGLLMPSEFGRIGYPGSILFNLAPWLVLIFFLDNYFHKYIIKRFK
jgi:hypothetical protein